MVAKYLISNFPNIDASFIHDCNDTLMGLFHQVTDDLVVEVINLFPFNALTLVLLLFLLQYKL